MPPLDTEDQPYPAPIAPLDYSGTPDASGATTPATPPVGFSLHAFVVTGFATTVVLFILAGVVPRLGVVFKDFGVQLPLATQLVLGASDLFLRTPVWLTGPAIVISVATAIAFIPLPRRALRLLITLILTVVVLIVALAVLMPMVSLITTVSNGGGGKH